MAAPVTPSYLTWKPLIERQRAPSSPSNAVTSDPKLITKLRHQLEATCGCQVCVSRYQGPRQPHCYCLVPLLATLSLYLTASSTQIYMSSFRRE